MDLGEKAALWREISTGARVFELPMRMPFRGVTTRQGVLIEGPTGWGEFSAFPEYSAAEASWWLDSAVEAAWVGWPDPIRSVVRCNAIIPGVHAAQALELARQAQAAGYRTVKVKVAGPRSTLADDVARVAAVRSAFSGDIRVDANGAWQVAEALTAITELVAAAGSLAYVEQPCANLADLAYVRTHSAAPIAVDESIRRADDPIAAAAAAAADILVVKVAPLGGVRRALRVVAASGLPVVVSSAIDTSVGLAAGVALAACLPKLAGDCGLATGELLADDVADATYVPSNGELPAGMGVAVDPQALARAEARVSAADRRWWREHLAAAWRAGTDDRIGALLADSGS